MEPPKDQTYVFLYLLFSRKQHHLVQSLFNHVFGQSRYTKCCISNRMLPLYLHFIYLRKVFGVFVNAKTLDILWIWMVFLYKFTIKLLLLSGLLRVLFQLYFKSFIIRLYTQLFIHTPSANAYLTSFFTMN